MDDNAPSIAVWQLQNFGHEYWVLSVNGYITARDRDRQVIESKAEAYRVRWQDSDGPRA